MRRFLNIVVAGLLIALSLAACQGGAGNGTAQQPTMNPLVVASDLAVGQNRFVFAILDEKDQPVDNASVHVRFLRVVGNSAQPAGEADAAFRSVTIKTPHPHEGGQLHEHQEARGVYVVDNAAFNAAGVWQAELSATLADRRGPFTLSASFQVKPRSDTPALGAPVPASRNKTAKDVQNLKEISTMAPPNPALYRLSVAQALAQRRPFLAVFASPAFCQSRICGPVTEETATLLPKYGDRMELIHIEPYDLNAAQNQGRLLLTPIAREWNLPSEPWVFIVDGQGRIAAKFEGIVTAQELEGAIQKVLGSTGGAY